MMKSFQSIRLIVLLFCSISISSSGQNTNASNFNELIASRNGIEKHYKPNTQLFLAYETDSSLQKIKGIFMGVVDGKVVIIRKKKSIEKTLVPLENITILKTILR